MLKWSHLCHLVTETRGQVRAEDSCLNSWGSDEEDYCSFNYVPSYVYLHNLISGSPLISVCIKVYANIWQETSPNQEYFNSISWDFKKILLCRWYLVGKILKS